MAFGVREVFDELPEGYVIVNTGTITDGETLYRGVNKKWYTCVGWQGEDVRRLNKLTFGVANKIPPITYEENLMHLTEEPTKSTSPSYSDWGDF